MKGRKFVTFVLTGMLLSGTAMPEWRYAPKVPPHKETSQSKELKKIYVNVREMELRKFIPYLAGLTGERIILMDKDAKEKVSFSGYTTLPSLLDTVLPPLGYWWERDRTGAYRISRNVTRVWKIDLPAVMRELSFRGQKGEGISYSFSYREEVSKTIVSLLQGLIGKAGTVEYNPFTGLLVFHGPLKSARALDPVVGKLSEILKQTIKLRIEIVALRLYKENQTGVNLNSLIRAGFPVGINIQTANPASPFSFSLTTSRAESFFTALEKFGKLRSIDSKEFNVISGFPVVYSTGGKISYLKRVSIAYLQTYQGATTAIPSVNIETGEETSGTDFILIPKKLSDGTLSLEVMFSQKTIDAIEEKTFTVQGQDTTLQLPQVSYSNFQTLSNLEEGEELILVSSVMDLNRSDRQGVPFLIRIPVIRFLFGKSADLSDKVQFIVRVRYEESYTDEEYLSR